MHTATQNSSPRTGNPSCSWVVHEVVRELFVSCSSGWMYPPCRESELCITKSSLHPHAMHICIVCNGEVNGFCTIPHPAFWTSLAGLMFCCFIIFMFYDHSLIIYRHQLKPLISSGHSLSSSRSSKMSSFPNQSSEAFSWRRSWILREACEKR